MISLREPKQKTKADACKDSSTLNKKTDDKRVRDDKNNTSIIFKSIYNPKARKGQELNKQDPDKEVESVMIVATPPSKILGSRKRKRETEEASPSADAVSEKNLKETAPMILARWKTVVYKGSSAPRKLADVTKGMEVSMSLTTEEDFRPQKANTKRGSTSGQTWEVDVGKKWLSTQHQVTGKQVASDLLEKNATRNTARP